MQSFNVNYSDSGLFGVCAVTVPENSEVVIKTAVEQIKELSSKPVDATTLQGAKYVFIGLLDGIHLSVCSTFIG